MKINILGGGISAISLAYFLQKSKHIKEINIFEKSEQLGGLLRSYDIKNIKYDVGPHIIFSKHKDILKIILKILGKNKKKIRRSNKILYKKNILIKYPFENELYKLPKKDLDFAMNKFLNNRYNNIIPDNMKKFFLKNFGEGITKLYLEPYNRKIWKFPVEKLDTQMVSRIPQPPKEDIIKSSKGISTEGYKHQLYFHYPKAGGIESLFKCFEKKLNNKVKIFKNVKIEKIKNINKSFKIIYKKNEIYSDKLISTIPLNDFYKYFKSPLKVRKISKRLKYNSIIISIVNIKGDIGGNNFAFMVPDKKIIFHRLSKLDFLGNAYSKKNSTTFEVEITFRKNTHIDKASNNLIYNKIISGLKKLGFLKSKNDINFYQIKRFDYAYVIYDTNHRKNVDYLINYYNKKNIQLLGRWGSWEYLNSDQVIYQARNMAKNILKKIN
jgi:protoporphyrinogen oxidase